VVEERNVAVPELRTLLLESESESIVSGWRQRGSLVGGSEVV